MDLHVRQVLRRHVQEISIVLPNEEPASAGFFIYAFRMPKHVSIVPVALATFAYLLPAAFIALITGNAEFVAYIVVVLVIGLGVWTLHRRVGLSQTTLWLLSVWGLLHMLGGLCPAPEGWPVNGTKAVLYSLWIIPGYLKYDHIVHAFGFGTATLACWEAVRGQLRSPLPRTGILILCLLGGMGLGAVNEIVEFMAVLLIPNTNVGGYENTGWDLVSNLVGSCVAAAVIASSAKRR